MKPSSMFATSTRPAPSIVFEVWKESDNVMRGSPAIIKHYAKSIFISDVESLAPLRFPNNVRVGKAKFKIIRARFPSYNAVSNWNVSHGFCNISPRRIGIGVREQRRTESLLTG